MPVEQAAWIVASRLGERHVAGRPAIIEICSRLMLISGAASLKPTSELCALVVDAVRRGDVVLLKRPLELHGSATSTQEKPATKDEPAAPQTVDPIIEPASLVIVVPKRARNPATRAREPYTHPARRPVILRTNTAFDGTATFTWSPADRVRFFSAAVGGTEIRINGRDNVFRHNRPPAWVRGASLATGVTVYAEAAAPSSTMDDITLRLSLSGGSRTNGPDDTARATAVELTLDIFKSRPTGGGDPPLISQDDKVHKGRFLLGQKQDPARIDTTLDSPHERALVIIRKAVPNDFDGTLRLVAGAGMLQLFENEQPTDGEAPITNPFTIPNADIPADGRRLFLEATHGSVSGSLRDTGLLLGIHDGEREGDRVNVTVLDVVLDAGQSRAAVGAPPTPMGAASKISVGRFVHEQIGHHHGRAALIVKKVRPHDFRGRLSLRSINDKVALFRDEDPSSRGAALSSPHEIDVTTIPDDGLVVFAEGVRTSEALRDTGFRLTVKDELENDGDRVNMTVVKLTNLQADIPSTAAVQERVMDARGTRNSPVPRHTLILARGGIVADTDYDHDFEANVPIVLIEGSVKATDKINLSVAIAPADAAQHVSWSIHRDRRTSEPRGDHPQIIALEGNSDDPGLTPQPEDRLRAMLTANAVGSFHIQPFIDNNGNGTYEFADEEGRRIDREPFICMNLVLVRVEGLANFTAVNPAPPGIITARINYFGTGLLTVPHAARTGDFGANPAITMRVVALLTGGGPAGMRGLERVFAGWTNNELNAATSPGPGGLGEDVTHRFRRRHLSSVRPNPSAQTRCFWQLNGTELSGPMLDSGAFIRSTTHTQGTGGNTCTGTAGSNDCPVDKGPDQSREFGAVWDISNVDSPATDIRLHHPDDDGVMPEVARRTLRNFNFNLDFRCALVFWTNRDRLSGPADLPACRLYSTLCTMNWTVRCESDFDDGFAESPITPMTITFTPDDVANRRATPLDGGGIETRGPDGFNNLRSHVPF